MSRRALLAFCLVAATGPTVARAQLSCNPCDHDPAFRPWGPTIGAGDLLLRLELNLSPPGARSLGMGGAFAGLSDDSSTALTNPAALSQILRPELAFEMRRGASRADTAGATTIRLAPGTILGTVGSSEPPSSRRSPAEPAYLAGTYAGKRWAVAAYRHQLANLRSQGAEIEIDNTGLSAAWRLHRVISIGATFSRYRGYALIEDRIFGAAGAPPIADTSTRIDDAKNAFAGGVFLRPSHRWSLGAYYRQGAALRVDQEVKVLSINTVNLFEDPPLELPRVWGLGVGYRPTESLLLDFDWSRALHVRHRQIPPAGGGTSEEKQSREVDHLALGAEYSFWEMAWAPALRLGLSTRPNPLPAPPGMAPATQDRLLVSAGAGLVFRSHWQFDIAIQGIGRAEPSMSISTVVRF